MKVRIVCVVKWTTPFQFDQTDDVQYERGFCKCKITEIYTDTHIVKHRVELIKQSLCTISLVQAQDHQTSNTKIFAGFIVYEF